MFFHLLPKSSIKVVLEQNVIELQKNCHENVMEPIRFEINYSWVWRIFFQLTNLVMNGDYQNVLSALGLSTMTTYKNYTNTKCVLVENTKISPEKIIMFTI